MNGGDNHSVIPSNTSITNAIQYFASFSGLMPNNFFIHSNKYPAFPRYRTLATSSRHSRRQQQELQYLQASRLADNLPIATQPTIPMDTGSKAAGAWVDHSPPTSAEINKTWIYTSNPLYVFMA
jgi:hypothetical protein